MVDFESLDSYVRINPFSILMVAYLYELPGSIVSRTYVSETNVKSSSHVSWLLEWMRIQPLSPQSRWQKHLRFPSVIPVPRCFYKP